jgi:hypothetical protein
VEDADIGTELLADIHTIFEEDAAVEDGAITAVLLGRLHDMADRPWPVFGKTEKPLTAKIRLGY